MTGISLDLEGWAPVLSDGKEVTLSTPMPLYATETGIERRRAGPRLAERDEDFADAICLCVTSIRDFWLPYCGATHSVRRESPTVGRSDPCPRGSDLRFKERCGRRGWLR